MTRVEPIQPDTPTPAEPAVAEARAEKHVPWYDRAKFSLVRWFLAAWAATFSLKGLYLFGQWFGWIEYVINFKRRARYRRELEGVFPEGLTKARAAPDHPALLPAHAVRQAFLPDFRPAAAREDHAAYPFPRAGAAG